MGPHRDAQDACRSLHTALIRASRQRSIARATHYEERRLIGKLGATITELREVVEDLLERHIELEQDRNYAEQQMWRYQTLFDTAPDAYVVTDAGGAIVDVNGVAQQLLDEDAHRLIGTPLGQLLLPVDGCTLHTQLADVVAVGTRDAWELHVLGQARRGLRVTASVTTGRAVSGELELRWILHASTSGHSTRPRQSSANRQST
jgi:PAS domain S-box-containing protein